MGIDPGLTGAIAIIERTPGKRYFIEIHDMPVHKLKIGKSIKSRVDVHALADILYCNPAVRAAGGAPTVFIEDVTASPQMGVTSAFQFGLSYGLLQGIIAANKLVINRVTPAKWKKDMKLTANKDVSRRRASELFPDYAHLWPRAMDDGRAEAVLLACWGCDYG